ncbi:MAG: tripartite tricarboxylate transporter substrate binding protein [Clostridia bacterium]
MLRRFLLLFSLCAVLPAGAIAQPYPSRPITLVSPFAPGGAVDAMARVLAAKLAASMGQPVVVENRAGAGGAIGMGSVARAQPDGYTLLYTPNSIAIGPALYRKLPFDAEKDFAPVSQVLSSTLVLAAHPKLHVSSLKEFIALAKAQPGKLNFGSSGVADPLQLGMELLKTSAGIDLLAIPYKGQGPMFSALLAGEVDVAIASLQIALAPIRTGGLNVLAVTGSKRSVALPDVPTVAESGFPGFDVSSWHGVFAPAGTPPEIVEHLSKEVAAAVAQPDVRKRVEATGNEVVGSTPDEFSARFHGDVARFKKIVQDAHIPYQD